jgi:hypothetical protein
MRKNKFLRVVIVALLLSVLPFGGGALATASPSTVSFQYVKVKTVKPGKVWVDKDGMHIRGRVDSGKITGDLKGSAVVTYNADLGPFVNDTVAPAPGSGTAYGTIKITTTQVSTTIPSQIWEGSWSYTILNGKVVGGEMTATNFVSQLKMTIVTVNELSDGKLNHTGTIEPLVCVHPEVCAYPVSP